MQISVKKIIVTELLYGSSFDNSIPSLIEATIDATVANNILHTRKVLLFPTR